MLTGELDDERSVLSGAATDAAGVPTLVLAEIFGDPGAGYSHFDDIDVVGS